MVGTLKPGSALQLEPEPEPEPELQPAPALSQAQAQAEPAVAAAGAAQQARLARLEDQGAVNYYAGKPEKSLVDVYGRGPPVAWAAASSAAAAPPIPLPGAASTAAATAAPMVVEEVEAGEEDEPGPPPPPPIQVRPGDLLRVVDFADSPQYNERIGVATGRRNAATGRFGIALPMVRSEKRLLCAMPFYTQK